MGAALPLSLALSLAAQAAPAVAPDTLVTFAQQESGLHALAIHDNTTGRSYDPETQAEAVALATTLVLNERHVVDLGLMQVSFRGATREGLSIRDAFTPAASMRTGAAILVDAYRTCQGRVSGAEATLRCAAALYNAGGETAAGRRYAARIWRTAAQVVPSIGKIITADFPEAAPDTGTTAGIGVRRSTDTIIAPNHRAVSIFVRPGRTGHQMVLLGER